MLQDTEKQQLNGLSIHKQYKKFEPSDRSAGASRGSSASPEKNITAKLSKEKKETQTHDRAYCNNSAVNSQLSLKCTSFEMKRKSLKSRAI